MAEYLQIKKSIVKLIFTMRLNENYFQFCTSTLVCF